MPIEISISKEPHNVALVVGGCRHATLGVMIMGLYQLAGGNHGRPTYQKVGQVNGLDVMLYFWDERDGTGYCGWFFSPKVGGDEVWGYHTDKFAVLPPQHGWKVPYDGPVDPTLVIQMKPKAAAGHPQQQVRASYRPNLFLGDEAHATMATAPRKIAPPKTAPPKRAPPKMAPAIGADGEAAPVMAPPKKVLRLRGSVAKQMQDADMCPRCNIQIATKFCGDCGTRSARISDASMLNELGSALAASLRDVQIIGCRTDKGEEVENEDDWDALRFRFAEMATASSIKEESESDEELVATIGEIVHVSIANIFNLQPSCSSALRNRTTLQTLTSLIKSGRHDPMKDDFLILNAAMANIRLSRTGGSKHRQSRRKHVIYYADFNLSGGLFWYGHRSRSITPLPPAGVRRTYRLRFCRRPLLFVIISKC